jgi:hypothetical protein
MKKAPVRAPQSAVDERASVAAALKEALAAFAAGFDELGRSRVGHADGAGNDCDDGEKLLHEKSPERPLSIKRRRGLQMANA